MINVIEVTTNKHARLFRNLPDIIYKHFPYYVPQLKIDDKELMNPKKHPFHQHGLVAHFLAFDGTQVVGRIAAIRNDLHNQYYQDHVGFFGLFEAINDQSVANALLDTAAKWLKQHNLTHMRGPMNYSYTESQGLLVEGYDSHPAALLTYNPPYYKDLLERYGLGKQLDLYAYECEVNDVPLDIFPPLLKRCQRRGIEFDIYQPRQYKSELIRFTEIVNDFEPVNTDNFYPFTYEKSAFVLKKLQPIIHKELICFAKLQQETIGFACAIPDYHEYFVKNRSGNLFPFGLYQLLKMKVQRPKRFKFVLLGIKDTYKSTSLATTLVGYTVNTAKRLGYTKMDMSLIHQDNIEMNRLCHHIKAKRYKTYRIYEGTL